MIPFGIDFGTSNIVISYYQNNKYNFIIDDTGSNLIPNIINIKEDKSITFGNNIDGNNIKNIKRLIGLSYTSEYITENRHLYPFLNSTTQIDELLVLIFKQLSAITENNIGIPIKIAVITVPAYFSDCQRLIIRTSATNAGIEVLKIINEPTSAAVIAADQNQKEDGTFLIYDLGGGTLDITKLEYNKELDTYNVLSTVGESHLGGEDFDNKLASSCIREFCSKYKIDYNLLTNDYKVYNRVLSASKKCKEVLSSSSQSNIYIESLWLSNDMDISITRSKFDNICYHEFSKCASLINSIDTKDVTNVVLVGGASRMPKIKTILQNKIPNSIIVTDFNPDLIVAMGAAKVAYQLYISHPVLLLDITPLPIGIEISDGIMANIIEKNEHLPISRVKVFSTEYDNQPSFNLNIYEGDYEYAKQNNFLGCVSVNNLPLRKKGDLKIFIKFKVDNDGILSTNIKYDKVKIKNVLKKMKDKTKIHNHDTSFIEKSLVLLKFKDYLINTKYLFEEHNINYPKVDKLIAWITQINTPSNLKIDMEFILKMKKHVEDEVNNFISQYLVYETK